MTLKEQSENSMTSPGRPVVSIRQMVVLNSLLQIALAGGCMYGLWQRFDQAVLYVVIPSLMLVAGGGGLLTQSLEANPRWRPLIVALNGAGVFFGVCVVLISGLVAVTMGSDVRDAWLWLGFGLLAVISFMGNVLLIPKLPSNRFFTGPLYL